MRRTGRRSLVIVASAFVAALLPALPARADTAADWQRRAVQYAPVLVLHRAESWRPSSVAWALSYSELKFSRAHGGDATLYAAPSATRLGDSSTSPYNYTHNGRRYLASDCTRPREDSATCARTGLKIQEGFYLDLYDGRRAGPPNASSTPGRYAGAEIYYQYGPSRLGGYFLTYWFFYPYNRFAAWDFQVQAHEGDWERMTLRFDSSLRPVQVAYHYHECHAVYSWGSVPKFSITHPVAYVAKGSHGIWRGAGGRCKPGAPSDQTDSGGLRWYTWTGSVAWVRSRGFYGFGGAWGEVGEFSWSTGPLGPSRYKSYSAPF